jgi:hypothetical protein
MEKRRLRLMMPLRMMQRVPLLRMMQRAPLLRVMQRVPLLRVMQRAPLLRVMQRVPLLRVMMVEKQARLLKMTRIASNASRSSGSGLMASTAASARLWTESTGSGTTWQRSHPAHLRLRALLLRLPDATRTLGHSGWTMLS